MPRSKALALLSLATLFAPIAFGQRADPARPGTLNYVEGSASLNGRPLSSESIGRAELQAGETIETTDGRIELLLTPGVFLRLDNNIALQMISPDLTHTELKLDRGRAEVEVDQLYKQNNLQIDGNAAKTHLLQDGVYEFDATRNQLRVFEGKAEVSSESNASGKPVEVKAGREFNLAGDEAKAQKFNDKHYDDALVDWSSLRSEYLSGNTPALKDQYGLGGNSFGPGWYMNSSLYGFGGYGFSPFYSPFGYGFYGPGLYSGLYGFGSPFGFGGYGYGLGGYGLGGYGGAYVSGNGYGRQLHNNIMTGRGNGAGRVNSANRPAGNTRSAPSGAGSFGGGGNFHGGGSFGGGGFHGGGGGGHR